jgi:glycerate kinase
MVKHGRGEVTDGIEIIVACDVTNPLYGEEGAARIYGPQKGATEEIVAKLDNDLRELAQRTGKEQEAIQAGAGAAGGLGFGMLAFFGASLRSGFDLIADAAKLRDRLANADLCFTGEGRIDGQSASGKTVGGVARICRETRVPCIALVGAIGEGAEKVLQQGLSEFIAISDRPLSVDHVGDQLAETAANYLRRRDHQP